MGHAEPYLPPQSIDNQRRVVLWGTFDLGKPRVRIMRDALAAADVELVQIGRDVWSSTRDKSQISGFRMALKLGQVIMAWPGLWLRYARTPAHDVVVIGYFGLFDMLAIAIPARLRGVPVIWDAFLSVYDTVVHDRTMLHRRSPMSKLIHWVENLACRLATVVVLDTRAHADYFGQEYSLNRQKLANVMVGCEDAFATVKLGATSGTDDNRKKPVILFYGQFIPLHGIETIIDAACLPGAERFEWRVIGTGQEAAKIRAKVDALRPQSLRWTEWVEYEDLVAEIASADICLGVFGTSAKAGRVIPNKVFQILAAGKPLVTRDGAGIRELVGGKDETIALVPPGDPKALLKSIDRILGNIAHGQNADPDLNRKRFSFPYLVHDWSKIVNQAIKLHRSGDWH